jgi:outer membrane autotransporter protein
MKWFYAIILLLLPMAEAHGKDNTDVQIFGRYGYNASRLNVAQNLKATYSGAEFGGKAVFKAATKKQYGIGFTFGIDKSSLDNTANTETESETIEGTQLALTARFYALNLFIGGGFLFNSFDLSYRANAGATPTITNYSGVGLRIESGIDLELKDWLIVTPALHYDFLDVSSKGTSSIKRLNSFGAGIGLGVQF